MTKSIWKLVARKSRFEFPQFTIWDLTYLSRRPVHCPGVSQIDQYLVHGAATRDEAQLGCLGWVSAVSTKD